MGIVCVETDSIGVAQFKILNNWIRVFLVSSPYFRFRSGLRGS